MSQENEVPEYTIDTAEYFVGRVIGTSDWHTVSQEEITAFGDLTHDPDPNHVDPEWARENGSFGYPIVFGVQTMSLLTFLCTQARIMPSGVVEEYNYGFDSLRFVAPVPAGARIQARCELKDVRSKGPNHKILTIAVEVAIEGGDRPALVATWLAMVGGANYMSK